VNGLGGAGGVIRRFCRDERGATAIEYALIIGIMSMAVIAIAATGGALDGVYQRVSLIIAALGGG
jgi:Flp pilus assembly pilin Flp